MKKTVVVPFIGCLLLIMAACGVSEDNENYGKQENNVQADAEANSTLDELRERGFVRVGFACEKRYG